MRISFLGQGEEPVIKLTELEISENISVGTNRLSNAESFYILEFAIDGDSLNAAKELAEIRDNPLFADLRLLDDDPSERFERDLFKQIALFERRIRKLLTICLCPKEGRLNVGLVIQLEKLTFGELFNALFIDEQFNKAVKIAVNQRPSLFEKQELMLELSGINENSLWIQTFSKDEMPSLRDGHKMLQQFRNDTMHAHRMTLGTYKDANRLIQTINKELNDSIQRRLDSILDFDYSQLAQNLSKTLETLKESLLKSYNLESLKESLLKLYNFESFYNELQSLLLNNDCLSKADKEDEEGEGEIQSS